jgi:S-adenosylmethionine-dependent methyltransferase
MKEAEFFYDQNAEEEWGRLDRHRTEFAVTLRALEDYLPPSPASILDIGGGPGRYSIELAARGYSVTLLDVSRESLRLAKEKAEEEGVRLKETIHSNALDLEQSEPESFDAVLLMGPLYHLLLEEERAKAVREAVGVLKPGGRFFGAVVTRFAPFRESASSIPDWVLKEHDYALRILDTGLHEEPKKWARAYFMHPDELILLMDGCGLQPLLIVGCEGIVAGHEERVNALQGEDWQIWVELNYRLGKEPCLYGASDHLLYIGEKPG